jgi:hypothetical protein
MASNRILEIVDKGDLKILEREVELFQKFIFNKIVSLKQKIRLNVEQMEEGIDGIQK